MPYTQAQVDDLAYFIRAGSNDDELTELQKQTWTAPVELALRQVFDDYDDGNVMDLLFDMAAEDQQRVIDRVIENATSSEFSATYRARQLTGAWYVVHGSDLYTAWARKAQRFPPKKLHQNGYRFQLEGVEQSSEEES